jgi:hypothetical protein
MPFKICHLQRASISQELWERCDSEEHLGLVFGDYGEGVFVLLCFRDGDLTMLFNSSDLPDSAWSSWDYRWTPPCQGKKSFNPKKGCLKFHNELLRNMTCD